MAALELRRITVTPRATPGALALGAETGVPDARCGCARWGGGDRARPEPCVLAALPSEPGEFDPSAAVSYYPQDREAGYILLCTAKARSNLRIRTHVQTEMRTHRKEIGLPAPYA